jgi:hypothetical protein
MELTRRVDVIPKEHSAVPVLDQRWRTQVPSEEESMCCIWRLHSLTREEFAGSPAHR